jgi:hypothetical protein
MISNKIPIDSLLAWEAQKVKLKLWFPKLTDPDLDFGPAQKTEMLTRLEFKLALTTKELQTILEQK